VKAQTELDYVVAQQPYPLMFVTLSGAHLYGFPSPDSDFDLRGVHVLPLPSVVGLEPGEETRELSEVRGGVEIDLVTHDVRKFFQLMLKKNGYVLEQLYSPLVLHTSPEHEALKEIGKQCITRHHSHHYLGFADNQWQLFEKERPHRVKPVLYLFRVLLTGIHLMQTGEIEANLLRLNEIFQLSYIQELVDLKLQEAEQTTLSGSDVEFFEGEYQRLRSELVEATAASSLPELPAGRDALNDLLIQMRLAVRSPR